MAAIGEIEVTFTRDKWSVLFRAIVVENLSSDIYGGMTFLIDNDISLRPSKGEIKILNKYVIFQTNTMMLPPQIKSMEPSSKIVKLKKCRILPDTSAIFSSTKDEKVKLDIFLSIDVPEDI